MLCEKVLGNLCDTEFVAGLEGARVDHVDVDWHEAFKKLHRKTSEQGREVGIRLGDWVLSRGLSDGDVLGVEEGPDGEKTVVAVRLLPTKCLVIDVAADHAFMLARVGWEVGNTHTPLFWGEGGLQLLCEYTEPVERLLSGLHAVTVSVADRVLDPARRVSSSARVHPHGGHDHGHGTHEHDHGAHDHAHGPGAHDHGECCHGGHGAHDHGHSCDDHGHARDGELGHCCGEHGRAGHEHGQGHACCHHHDHE